MPEWGAVSTLHRGRDDVLSNCLPTPVLPSGPPPAWTLDHLGIQSEIWGMISSWDQYNVACKAYATTRWIKLKMESKTLGDAPVLMFTRLCRRRLLWTRPNWLTYHRWCYILFSPSISIIPSIQYSTDVLKACHQQQPILRFFPFPFLNSEIWRLLLKLIAVSRERKTNVVTLNIFM